MLCRALYFEKKKKNMRMEILVECKKITFEVVQTKKHNYTDFLE